MTYITDIFDGKKEIAGKEISLTDKKGIKLI